MALSSEGEKILRFALESLPQWFRDDARAQEYLGGCAAMFQVAREQIVYWFDMAKVSMAEGPTATTPDWLGQHAVDRGTRRQAAESSPVLRERIRNVPQALTRASILEAVQAVLDAAGVVGTAALLELRRDRAFIVTHEPDTGTGGVFAKTGSVVTFTPDVGFGGGVPPYRPAEVWPPLEHRVVISGAATAGNDGTFPVTGISGNGAQYTNAGGAAEVDPTVSWRVDRYRNGNLRTGGSGRQAAYVSRGYRIGSSRSTILLILPFGTTEGTRLGVLEALRQKKAAGFKVISERRLNP